MMLNVHCLCKMKDNKILSKTEIYEVLYLGLLVQIGIKLSGFWQSSFFFVCLCPDLNLHMIDNLLALVIDLFLA